MKQYVLEFLRRGISACGLGPVVLAVLYLILGRQEPVQTLTAEQVSISILSLTALAFVAGGVNVLYQIERLPLLVAILIHGCVLYGCYLVVYLVNDWLEWNGLALLVFSGIFVAGYVVIWAVIYAFIKRSTNRMNKMLRQKQQEMKD